MRSTGEVLGMANSFGLAYNKTQETLRKQVVVCMPVVNPDGYLVGTFTSQ